MSNKKFSEREKNQTVHRHQRNLLLLSCNHQCSQFKSQKSPLCSRPQVLLCRIRKLTTSRILISPIRCPGSRRSSFQKTQIFWWCNNSFMSFRDNNKWSRWTCSIRRRLRSEMMPNRRGRNNRDGLLICKRRRLNPERWSNNKMRIIIKL